MAKKKKLPHTVLSSKGCTAKGCTKKIKQRLIDIKKASNIDMCYKHHIERERARKSLKTMKGQ